MSATVLTAERAHSRAARPADGPVPHGFGDLFERVAPLLVDADRLQGLDASVEAGWPFFGQFVAHDVTAAHSPPARRPARGAVRNFRGPRADLEVVYGAGPAGSPYLYERDDSASLLLGPGGLDVARDGQGIALIGDPRNDSHLLVSQLQVAFIRAHNLLVRRLRAGGASESSVFDAARRVLTWHYQWVLLHDFLPTLVGDDLTAELLDEPAAHYRLVGEPYLPLEFAAAAFRYGQAQIRPAYRINGGRPAIALFSHLIDFGPVRPEMAVDWTLFFDFAGWPPAQRARRIDGRLSSSLMGFLRRGSSDPLPSGEALARELGIEPLSADEVGLAEHGWRDETPLWYYVLRESAVRAAGDRLSGVGARIVADVLIGTVDADPQSYRCVEPGWRPTLPSVDPERFRLTDLLTTSGINIS